MREREKVKGKDLGLGSKVAEWGLIFLLILVFAISTQLFFVFVTPSIAPRMLLNSLPPRRTVLFDFVGPFVVQIRTHLTKSLRRLPFRSCLLFASFTQSFHCSMLSNGHSTLLWYCSSVEFPLPYIHTNLAGGQILLVLFSLHCVRMRN